MSWQLSIGELITATKGKALSQSQEAFTGVGTDTRADLKGKLFVALRGEAHDAHQYLDKAVQAGAAGLLVDKLESKFEVLKEKVTIVEVADTLKAFQDLGNFWRKKMNLKVVGITGSNGKTTTKEFTAAILSTKFNTHFSKGSFNNHWGVPISLLEITPAHEIAVIEMGMNAFHEIETLVKIAEPDIVTVTMVGQTQGGALGGIEGVAKAKEEIYKFAPASALQIFNLDNQYTLAMYERAKALGRKKVLTFSSSEKAADFADVYLKLVHSDENSIMVEGKIGGVQGRTRVPVFGTHNVNNLMTASAIAYACGMSGFEIWAALPNCRTGWGRNQWVQTKSGGRVLFDAYNASPDSMRAALSNFAVLPKTGRKIAVLGEMRELGEQTIVAHQELAREVARVGFDEVVFIGPTREQFAAELKLSGFSKNLVISESCEHFLASEKLPVLNQSDIALIKGSRGIKLELLLKQWHPIDFGDK